jgi:hypothetical protein
MSADETTGQGATPEPLSTEEMEALRELLGSVGSHPWFLSDCEGTLAIWREAALKHVSRDENGDINGYSTPGSYRRNDLVAEWDLDTWDEGEDEDDDERRRMAELVVEGFNLLPRLLAEADCLRLRAEKAEAEQTRLARSAEALRVNRDQLKNKLAAADKVIADLKAELAEMESAAADWAARLVGHQARDDQAESRIAKALDLASRLDPTSGHGRVRAFVSDLRNVLTGGGR